MGKIRIRENKCMRQKKFFNLIFWNVSKSCDPSLSFIFSANFLPLRYHFPRYIETSMKRGDPDGTYGQEDRQKKLSRQRKRYQTQKEQITELQNAFDQKSAEHQKVAQEVVSYKVFDCIRLPLSSFPFFIWWTKGKTCSDFVRNRCPKKWTVGG